MKFRIVISSKNKNYPLLNHRKTNHVSISLGANFSSIKPSAEFLEMMRRNPPITAKIDIVYKAD